MPNSNLITVEVAYALPHQQLIIPVQVAPETIAEEAVKASGITAKFPEIDLSINQIGIFGKLTRLDTPLRHLDRVEIYRPLIADPKEVRKQRAADGKAMKKGGGDAPPEME
ncbi:MAG: RnfH family protein [Methylophilaceae bacterium]|nr:RnfH family protein [Methylophilaceae bacterium]MDG1453815.1 RnfH family protein [Methylophilaceae bacterium]